MKTLLLAFVVVVDLVELSFELLVCFQKVRVLFGELLVLVVKLGRALR